MTLFELRANLPKSIDDVDEWLANYMRFIEQARADALAHERLCDAAPKLLAALQIAVRQNSHDMLMTGEELRECEAAIAAATIPPEGNTEEKS